MQGCPQHHPRHGAGAPQGHRQPIRMCCSRVFQSQLGSVSLETPDTEHPGVLRTEATQPHVPASRGLMQASSITACLSLCIPAAANVLFLVTKNQFLMSALPHSLVQVVCGQPRSPSHHLPLLTASHSWAAQARRSFCSQ